MISAALLSLGAVRAEILKGKARQDDERATSEGSPSTACSPTAGTIAVWPGQTPTAVTADAKGPRQLQ